MNEQNFKMWPLKTHQKLTVQILNVYNEDNIIHTFFKILLHEAMHIFSNTHITFWGCDFIFKRCDVSTTDDNFVARYNVCDPT